MTDFERLKEYASDVFSDMAIGTVIPIAWKENPWVGAAMTALGFVYAIYRIVILHRKSQVLKKQMESYDALTQSFKDRSKEIKPTDLHKLIKIKTDADE